MHTRQIVQIPSFGSANPHIVGLVLHSSSTQTEDVHTTEPESSTFLRRVVICDDDPQIRTLLKKVFSKAGFKATEVGDAHSALAAISEANGDVDLLLSDINLQDESMDGVKLATQVRSQFPSLPVLFISGEPVSVAELNSAAPGNVFLQKPVGGQSILRAARELMGCVP